MVQLVEVIACRSDNYAYIVRDGDSGGAVLIDAPEAAPILSAIEAAGGRLDAILLTHHHGDHIEGVAEIRQTTGALVIGAAADRHRLPPLDREVADGDTVALGSLSFEVIATPGHTNGHVAFYVAAVPAVLTGDTLFSLGCGRLFEGTAAEMWQSLRRLAALPRESAIYPGHEYTAANGRFAITVDPDNAALIERLQAVEELTVARLPTIPVALGVELATNPFLRTGDPLLAGRLGLDGAPETEVFAELRRKKDVFR